MKVLLLLMLFIAGICYLNKSINNYRSSSEEVLVIIVKDQEPWVEGFLRKLFLSLRRMPNLKIIMLDDRSSDKTGELLVRLQRVYLFEFYPQLDTAQRASLAADYLFDARGLTGSALLNASVFCELKNLKRR